MATQCAPVLDRGAVGPAEPAASDLRRGLWATAARAATVGIFLLLFGATLYFAKTLIAPIVSAVVVGAMFGPLANRAARFRIPPVVFAIGCVALILLALYLAATLVGGAAANLTSQTSEIGAAFKVKAQFLERPIAALREFENWLAIAIGGTSVPLSLNFSAAGLIGPVVEFLTPAMGQIILFFATLLMLLASRNDHRRFVVLMFEHQHARLSALRILNDIERNVTRYVGVVTTVNLGLGLATTAIAYIFGLPNPTFTGSVAFLLNYIPYLGPTLTAALLLFGGIIALPTLLSACIAPAIFIAMATIEGHFVTPTIVGRQLTLSPLATFLSLVFWTWLWGPLGTLLANPFLIAMVVMREHLFRTGEVKLPG